MTARVPGRPALWVALLAVAWLLALGSAEALLRLTGEEPWWALAPPGNEPVMHTPDPVLGWRNAPGRYVFPAYTAGAPPIRMHYLEDGSRATGFAGRADAPAVVLVGGSFVQGWGLSDEDTLAFVLQQRHPGVRIENHGVGGYGTFQSLLRLEERLARDSAPALVLYGFIPLHESRNVGDPDWLYSLARASRSGLASVPFASHEGERLVRHPPERYPKWPLAERLAVVQFASDRLFRARAAGRAAQRHDVTRLLLREMHALCRRHGSRLMVAFLWAPPGARVSYRDGGLPTLLEFRGDRYAQELSARGIPFADCAEALTPDRVVAGEGHPNAVHNRSWADCLERSVAFPTPPTRGG